MSKKSKTARRVLASIEREMANAYDVGHAHGMNPMRNLNNQKLRRVNEGWGKYATKLFKDLKPMMVNDQALPQPPKAKVERKGNHENTRRL